MKHWLILLVAILAEVAGTLALKASDGFTRPWPSLLVVAGYGLAFYCLALTLRVIPVGVAYAVWSGIGLVLVTLAAWLGLGQKLDGAAVLGILLILAGVIVMNVFSNSVPH